MREVTGNTFGLTGYGTAMIADDPTGEATLMTLRRGRAASCW